MNNEKAKLITANTIFGSIGIFRKAIPLPSSMVSLGRGYIGFTYLLLAHILGGKPFHLSKLKKCLPILIFSGGLMGFTWLCLFESYRYTSLSTATMCHYMAPVFVILASPFVLHEPLSRRKGICSAVAVFGMVLVSGVLGSNISGLKGILFALASAVMYATTILINMFIDPELPSDEKTLIQLLCAGLAVTPYVLLTVNPATVTCTAVGLILLAILGCVHTGFAYSLYFGSIPNIPAHSVALLSYIDPVVAVLLSIFLLREPMTLVQGIGIVLMLGAMVLSEKSE